MIVPIQLDESTGDYFIEFPPDMIAQLGWQENDTLIWTENSDGTFTLKKKPDEDQL